MARHGIDLRFYPAQKSWLIWDGSRWALDDSGEATRRAKDTVMSIYGEAEAIPGDDGAATDQRKAIREFGKRCEAMARIKSMIKAASTEWPVVIKPAQLDAEPMLLNVANGTVDLRSGELQPHSRENYITRFSPIHYDPQARCPLFKRFLIGIFGGNRRLIRFLQRAIGYSLTGLTTEQVLFILHGTRANGKSTLLEIIMALAGDYGCQTPTDTLMVKKQAGGATNDIARLHGMRFVSAVETEEGQRLSETLVKQLTGGDPIAARYLFKEFFDFVPQFKLFIATNHRPEIRGTDYAIWRRIRLIPFEITITPEQQDKKLGEKLRAELPGILAWGVRGCLQWQRQGLGTPPEVLAATREYRTEMDVLQAFIDEKCVVGNGYRARFQSLYACYVRWCEEAHEYPLKRKAFGKRLSEKGYDAANGTGNVALRVGIGLLEDDSAPSRSFSNGFSNGFTRTSASRWRGGAYDAQGYGSGGMMPMSATKPRIVSRQRTRQLIIEPKLRMVNHVPKPLKNRGGEVEEKEASLCKMVLDR